MRLELGDIDGDFDCCPNAAPVPFKCSSCGHIMVYCSETNDLFPDLHDLKDIETTNSTDPSRPALTCPRCAHVFEWAFLRNPAYAVTREEMIEARLGHLLRTDPQN